ncbi:MAG: hypothetical protein V4496_00160 [Pseudomonadota bacterium]
MTLEELKNYLDARYRDELVRILLREVLFRFKCRVEEEKKFWSKTNVIQHLAHFQTQADGANTEVLISLLRSAIQTLYDDIDNKAYKKVFDAVSRIAIYEKWWSDDKFNIFNEFEEDFFITNIFYKLKEKKEQVERKIKYQLELEALVTEQQLRFGFDKIPEYQEMPEFDKRKYENLFLKAVEPDFSLPQILVSASSSNFDQAGSEKQEQNATLFHSVKNAFAKIYKFAYENIRVIGEVRLLIREIDENRLLQEVRNMLGGTESTEYKKVVKLLGIAKAINLNDDDIIEALSLIDYLKRQKKAAADINYLESIKHIFDVARNKGIEAEMRHVLSDVDQQVELLKKTEAAFEEYEKHLSEIASTRKSKEQRINQGSSSSGLSKQLNGSSSSKNILSTQAIKRINPKELPVNIDDLQFMAYSVFLKNTQVMRSDFCSWTRQTKLVMTEQYSTLMQEISGFISQNSSLPSPRYYAILIFSIALMQESQDSPAYELLHASLLGLVDGRLPKRVDEFFDLNLDWLLNSLPSGINVSSSLNGNLAFFSSVKEKILIFFPKPVKRQAPKAASFDDMSSASALDDSRVSFSSVAKVEEKTLSERAKIISGTIMGLKHDAYKTIDNFYPSDDDIAEDANPHVLEVLTLLRWFKSTPKGKGYDILDIEANFVKLANKPDNQLLKEIKNTFAAQKIYNKKNVLGRFYTELSEIVLLIEFVPQAMSTPKQKTSSSTSPISIDGGQKTSSNSDSSGSDEEKRKARVRDDAAGLSGVSAGLKTPTRVSFASLSSRMPSVDLRTSASPAFGSWMGSRFSFSWADGSSNKEQAARIYSERIKIMVDTVCANLRQIYVTLDAGKASVMAGKAESILKGFKDPGESQELQDTHILCCLLTCWYNDYSLVQNDANNPLIREIEVNKKYLYSCVQDQSVADLTSFKWPADIRNDELRRLKELVDEYAAKLCYPVRKLSFGGK